MLPKCFKKRNVKKTLFTKKHFLLLHSRPFKSSSATQPLTLHVPQTAFLKPVWFLIGMTFLPKLSFNDNNHSKFHLKTFKKFTSKRAPLLKKKLNLLYLKKNFLTKKNFVHKGINFNERLETQSPWTRPYLFLGRDQTTPKYLNFLNQTLFIKSKFFWKHTRRVNTGLSEVLLQKNWSLRIKLNNNKIMGQNFNSFTSLSKRKFFKKYLKHRSLQKKLTQSLSWFTKIRVSRQKVRKANQNFNPMFAFKLLCGYSNLALYKLRRKKEFLNLLYVQKTSLYPSFTRGIVFGVTKNHKPLQPTTNSPFLTINLKGRQRKKLRQSNFTFKKSTTILTINTNPYVYSFSRDLLRQIQNHVISKFKFKKSEYAQNMKLKLNSVHSLSFILPLYGFLFLTSYHSLTPNQSHLLTIQKYSFLYLNDFKKLLFGKFNKVAVFNKFFFEQKGWNKLPMTSKLNHQPSPSDLLSYFNQTYKTLFNLNQHKKSLVGEGLSLNRIKFKPGYSRLWRVARTTLKFLLNLKFTYQKKLTRYLVKFFRLNRLVLLKYNELKLSTVLTTTLLVPDRENSLLLISNNLVFVNGSLVLNPTFLIFKNDFLQLLVSVKYYILFRWLKNFQLLKRKRLNKFISNISLKKLNKDRKKNRVVLPSWTLNALLFNYDIPKYLEVDFFSLSAFCLYEPFLAQDFNPSLWNLEKTSIYNLYNWKYIT